MPCSCFYLGDVRRQGPPTWLLLLDLSRDADCLGSITVFLTDHWWKDCPQTTAPGWCTTLFVESIQIILLHDIKQCFFFLQSLKKHKNQFLDKSLFCVRRSRSIICCSPGANLDITIALSQIMTFTAHQIDREVSFEITMTFIIENVTLDNTKNTEKS